MLIPGLVTLAIIGLLCWRRNYGTALGFAIVAAVIWLMSAGAAAAIAGQLGGGSKEAYAIINEAKVWMWLMIILVGLLLIGLYRRDRIYRTMMAHHQ